MEAKFKRIADFVNSLEEESVLSDDLSVLLVGGNGAVRSTADSNPEFCGGGSGHSNRVCNLNTVAGCTNFSEGCINTAHACTNAPHGCSN